MDAGPWASARFTLQPASFPRTWLESKFQSILTFTEPETGILFSDILTMNITFSLAKKKVKNLLQILIWPHTNKTIIVQRSYCPSEDRCQILFWCSQVQGQGALYNKQPLFNLEQCYTKMLLDPKKKKKKSYWINCPSASNMVRTPKTLTLTLMT